jgi:hypothetical protein
VWYSLAISRCLPLSGLSPMSPPSMVVMDYNTPTLSHGLKIWCYLVSWSHCKGSYCLFFHKGCSSLFNVQCEKTCFVFFPSFSSFTWEGICGTCYCTLTRIGHLLGQIWRSLWALFGPGVGSEIFFWSLLNHGHSSMHPIRSKVLTKVTSTIPLCM